MEYDKYSDQLLAQQEAIHTSKIFEILLGYSWSVLAQAELAEPMLKRIEQLKKDPEFRKKTKAIEKKKEKAEQKKVEEAGKTAGTNLGASKWPPKIPQKSKWEVEEGRIIAAVKASAPQTRIAGRAYSILASWMRLKFHAGGNPVHTYSTGMFFAWIITDDILGRLEAQVEGFQAPARVHEFIGYLDTSKGTKPEPVRETLGIEDFVASLTFYFMDPCIFVKEVSKKATPHTLPSIGFKKPQGVTAQDFISILSNPIGPYYSLGPSHSNAGAGGRNISDVGEHGEYVPEDPESDEDMGLHIVADDEAQRVEIPEYRNKKARLIDIDKKLRNFIKKEFDQTLGTEFKLYEKVSEKGPGEYRFKFQTKLFQAINPKKFQSMDNESILAKLETLNNIGTEETLNEYMVLYAHAIKQGIPESEIEQHIKPKTR